MGRTSRVLERRWEGSAKTGNQGSRLLLTLSLARACPESVEGERVRVGLGWVVSISEPVKKWGGALICHPESFPGRAKGLVPVWRASKPRTGWEILRPAGSE